MNWSRRNFRRVWVLEVHTWKLYRVDFLKFGEDRKKLHTSFETFVDWLANKSISWVAYHEVMSGRLIAIDRHSGVFPVRVGETWRCLFTKILLRVTGPEATSMCQDD